MRSRRSPASLPLEYRSLEPERVGIAAEERPRLLRWPWTSYCRARSECTPWGAPRLFAFETGEATADECAKVFLVVRCDRLRLDRERPVSRVGPRVGCLRRGRGLRRGLGEAPRRRSVGGG